MKNQIQPVSADADVMRERDKLARLRAELSEGHRHYESLCHGKSPTPTEFDREVNEALGLEAPAMVATGDQDKAARKVRVLAAAVERQAKVVADTEATASQRIADQLKPEYLNIVKRGARAMAALRQFMTDEKAFVESLADADVKFGNVIYPMGLAKRFDDADIELWAQDAKQHYGIAV